MNKYIVTISIPLAEIVVDARDKFEAEVLAIHEYESEQELPVNFTVEVESVDGMEELDPLADFTELENGWDVEDGIYTDDEFDAGSYFEYDEE